VLVRGDHQPVDFNSSDSIATEALGGMHMEEGCVGVAFSDSAALASLPPDCCAFLDGQAQPFVAHGAHLSFKHREHTIFLQGVKKKYKKFAVRD